MSAGWPQHWDTSRYSISLDPCRLQALAECKACSASLLEAERVRHGVTSKERARRPSDLVGIVGEHGAWPCESGGSQCAARKQDLLHQHQQPLSLIRIRD